MKGDDCMCDNTENYFEWLSGDSIFRKLVIKDFETNFVKECDKFKYWHGEYRKCKKCNENYPYSDYFFKLKGSRGLSSTCKKCDNYKFSWGKIKKALLISECKKYCQKCDTVMPLNLLYFNKSIHSEDGYTSYCKKCVSSCSYGINRNLNEMIDKKDGHKVCLTCLYELPNNEEYYFKSVNISGGLELHCKECQGVPYGVTYINKVYAHLCKENEKYCSLCREIKNKDSFALNGNVSDGRDFLCKLCRAINNQLRRHGKYDIYTADDWQFALSCWKDSKSDCHCAYCDKIDENLTIEHLIPFSKGGDLVRENIIPICFSCNSSKNDDDLFTYYNKPNSKINENRLQKILKYIELCEKENIS